MKNTLAAVARRHGLEAVVLFGSRALGRARPDSDVDVCVVGGRPGLDDLDLMSDLSDALGGEVDVVRFERAGPVLRFHGIFPGRLLWGSPKRFAQLRLQVLKAWQDADRTDRWIEASLDRRR